MLDASNLEAAWEQADELYQNGNRSEAQEILQQIVDATVEAESHEGIRSKEQAIYRLGEIHCALKQPHQLVQLLRSIRSFFGVLPKAKTTKIVRRLFDNILSAGATPEEQKAICEEMIAWAKEEKRTFLRHRLEHRLAQINFDKGDCLDALATIAAILKEARRLDDKSLLVDVHLLESRVYYTIKNLSKARAALVAARTNANAIYCPPLAQAEIDMQSGILHAEEKDYKTAFSYLYEAFEGFHQLGDHAKHARRALRYMILEKILCEVPDELKTVLQTKSVLDYRGGDMDALRGVAVAFQEKDTHAFNELLSKHRADLQDDAVLLSHLEEMKDTLTEKHLLRVIEPYNRVQITFIANILKLSNELVESKVSQLILDKKLYGIVDQQSSCLIIFDAVDANADKDAHAVLFRESLETVESLDKLVTTLFEKIAGKFDNLVDEDAAKDGKKKSTAIKA